jgi:hypothetical protein
LADLKFVLVHKTSTLPRRLGSVWRTGFPSRGASPFHKEHYHRKWPTRRLLPYYFPWLRAVAASDTRRGEPFDRATKIRKLLKIEGRTLLRRTSLV